MGWKVPGSGRLRRGCRRRRWAALLPWRGGEFSRVVTSLFWSKVTARKSNRKRLRTTKTARLKCSLMSLAAVWSLFGSGAGFHCAADVFVEHVDSSVNGTRVGTRLLRRHRYPL